MKFECSTGFNVTEHAYLRFIERRRVFYRHKSIDSKKAISKIISEAIPFHSIEDTYYYKTKNWIIVIDHYNNNVVTLYPFSTKKVNKLINGYYRKK